MTIRRSQVYRDLRSRKLATGHYIVEQEPTGASYYVFKRAEDWAVVSRAKPWIKGGFRKKDDVMKALAEAELAVAS